MEARVNGITGGGQTDPCVSFSILNLVKSAHKSQLMISNMAIYQGILSSHCIDDEPG